MSLTGKQTRFVEEYFKDFNATRAAERAGYSGGDNALAAAGSRLLRNVKIKTAIATRLRETAMSVDEVIMRMAEQARADYSKYVQEDGTVDLELMKAEGKSHLIRKLRVDETEERRKIFAEFADPQWALDKIAKHLGMFTDRVAQLDIDLSKLSDDQLERIANGEDPIRVLAGPSTSGTGEAETKEEEKAGPASA